MRNERNYLRETMLKKEEKEKKKIFRAYEFFFCFSYRGIKSD